MIKNFRLTFIFSLIVHGALLFASSDSFNLFAENPKKISYAKESSLKIAIKMRVEQKTKQVIVQEVSTKKSAVKKKQIKKKTDKVSNLKKATKALGQSSIKALYLSRVRDILERNKIYPRLAKRLGHEGVVKATFILAQDGSLLAIQTMNGRYNTLKKSIKNIISKSEFPSFPK